MEIRKMPWVFTNLAFPFLIVFLTTQALAQKTFLEIEGQPVAVKSLQGGNTTVPSETERYGSVTTPVSVTAFAHPAHPELAKWIQGTLAGQVVTKSVGIHTVDREGNTIVARLYSGSVLSQITFSAMDNRIQTPVDISFTFNPGIWAEGKSSSTAPKQMKIIQREIRSREAFIVEHNLGFLPQDIQVYAVSSVTWQKDRGQVMISPVTFGIYATKDALKAVFDFFEKASMGSSLRGSIIVNILDPYNNMLQDSIELLNLTLVSYNPFQMGFEMTVTPGYIRYTTR